MNCYECAKTGTDSPAVASCPGCYAGLCLHHVRETASVAGPGGTRIGCTHDTWAVPAVAAAPAASPAPPAAGRVAG